MKTAITILFIVITSLCKAQCPSGYYKNDTGCISFAQQRLADSVAFAKSQNAAFLSSIQIAKYNVHVDSLLKPLIGLQDTVPMGNAILMKRVQLGNITGRLRLDSLGRYQYNH